MIIITIKCEVDPERRSINHLSVMECWGWGLWFKGTRPLLYKITPCLCADGDGGAGWIRSYVCYHSKSVCVRVLNWWWHWWWFWDTVVEYLYPYLYQEVHHYWKRADRGIELFYDLLLYYCIFVSLFVFVFYICITRRGPLLKEGGQRLRTALWAEKAFGNSWSGLRTIVFSVFVFVYNLYLFCSCVFLCIITWGSWTGLVLYL